MAEEIISGPDEESDYSRDYSSPEEYSDDDERESFVWSTAECQPRIHDFTATPGVNLPGLNAESTALDVFRAFFSRELVEMITVETNRYHEQNARSKPARAEDWKEVTTNEMELFLAIVASFGVIQKHDLDSFWSVNPFLFTPLPPETFTEERFMDLLHFLHFNNNENDRGDDKLYKLRPIIDTFNEAFARIYTPEQWTTTQASSYKFQGRSIALDDDKSQRSYLPLKVYRVLQCRGKACGYTCKIHVHVVEEEYNELAPRELALNLNKDLLGKGYNIALPKQFTCPKLLSDLHDQGCNVIGAARNNVLPRPLNKITKLKRGQRALRSTDAGLLAIVWRDRARDIMRMLSTMNKPTYTPSGESDRNGQPYQFPYCSLDYYHAAKCHYESEQNAVSHKPLRKHARWYMKIFFYLLDLLVLNSYLVYKLLGGPYRKRKLHKFREQLVMSILEENPDPRPPQTGRHFPVFLEPGESEYDLCRSCLENNKETLTRLSSSCDTCGPLCDTCRPGANHPDSS